MRKPNDWDNVQGFTGEGYPQLPKGGYVLKIMDARVSNNNGNEQLILLIDIAEGEYTDYYRKRYNSEKAHDPNGVKWKGVIRQFTIKKDGSTNPFFKGLINSIEKSNNYVFDFNENNLKGKLVGGLFAVEEFKGNDGKIVSVVKFKQARSVDVIRSGSYTLPEDELYKEAAQPFVPNYSSAVQDTESLIVESYVVDDDDLPF